MENATPGTGTESPRLRPESGQGLHDAMKTLSELKIKAQGAPDEDDDIFDETLLINQAPIVRLANAIIVNSIIEEAAEIRLEFSSRETIVRIRVNGVLRESKNFPPFIHAPLAQRFCIMANLPHWKAQHQPLSGVIVIRYNKSDYTLRFSSFPSLKGPCISLRIFDESLLSEAEGETAIDFESMFAVLQSGIFIFSSPPAEGKTTAAYQILRRLDTMERNVGVIEESQSYTLPGVTHVYLQSQYKPIPFADAVNAMRRQGADLLFLDDIDNAEKANIALAAAESGLMVLFSVTAMDSIGAIERLLRFGVFPARLAPALRGVLHQRLVNRICPDCRVPDEGPIPFRDWENAPSFHGAGCDCCNQTGVRRRVAVYETLQITPAVKEALRRNALGAKLRQELQGNIIPLADNLKEKVRGGVTPLSEAERVIMRG